MGLGIHDSANDPGLNIHNIQTQKKYIHNIFDQKKIYSQYLPTNPQAFLRPLPF